VQRPRLPIIIATLGLEMLQISAAFDVYWNSLSFLASFTGQLMET
jgi:hypothetical protein